MHTYNGVLLGHKEEWDFAICDNMDGPGEYYPKWTYSYTKWTYRERQILYDFAYMWNLKHKTNEQTLKPSQTQRHWERTCVCQTGGVWGNMWNMGGKQRCKIPAP